MKGQDSWIRLDGEVKMDDRREARAAMLEAVPVLKNMYNADDGVMTVFILITLKQRNIPLPANPKNWHNREFLRGGFFYRAVFFDVFLQETADRFCYNILLRRECRG